MNLRQLQSRKESADADRWEAIFAEDAFQAALESEAEAIASRRLKDPSYALRILDHDDLQNDTMIDAELKIDWRALVYMLLAGIMTPAQAREKLAKWLAANNDDIQREARGNIEGDAFDNLYDADDQWSD